jgi:ATP-dependent Zn protease
MQLLSTLRRYYYLPFKLILFFGLVHANDQQLPLEVLPNQADLVNAIPAEQLALFQEHIKKQMDDNALLINSAINASLEQLNMIHMMLSVLSNIIEDEKIPVHPSSLNFIKEISHVVQFIQKDKHININPHIAFHLLRINHSIMRNVIACLKNKPFTPSFLELMAKINEKPIDNLTQEHLKKGLVINSKLFERFKRAVDNVGLSKFNILCRRLDNTIGQFEREHDVLRRSTGTLCGISAITLFNWYFCPDFFQRNAPSLIQNALGETPLYESGTLRNADELGIVGKLAVALREHHHQTVGFLSISSALTYGYLYEEYQKKFLPFISKWYHAARNYGLGGAYKKEAFKVLDIIGSDVTFDDLIGMEEVKNQFEEILKYLEGPESLDRINATPPKGILMSGPTRSGKSFAAMALCGEYFRRMKRKGETPKNFKFLPITYSDFKEYGIEGVLKLVRTCAPCIVFIDEIDLLDLQRKGQNERLSEFLISMSGALAKIDPKNQIIIIAATNRPQHLDDALVQPGRFGKRILLDYPSHAHRKEFFKRKLNKLSLDIDFFDLDSLGYRTEGASYGALEMALSSAVLKAHLRNQGVTQEHLEAAIDECVHRIAANNDHVIPPHEKEILAAHFAGHALGLMLLDSYTKVAMVSIQPVVPIIKEKIMGMHLYQDQEMEEPKMKYGTIATYKQEESVRLETREEKLKNICYLVAGFVAEELLVGSCGYSCHHEDTQRALSIAQSITFEGLDPNSRTLPKEAKNKRFIAAEKLVEECKEKMRQLFTPHTRELQLLVTALKERPVLNAAEITQILHSSNK